MDILLGNKTSFDLEYSPEILFPIERSAARKKNGINNTLFNGYDVWNSYEFSYLNDKGKPENRILRLIYPADSQNIIESKSLKLYLGSFAMKRFTNESEVKALIISDLSKAVVSDKLSIEFIKHDEINPVITKIENAVLIDDIDTKIEKYNYDSSLLETENLPDEKETRIYSNMLRSLCPVTGQPDWATIYIEYVSDKKITELSLLKYIVSYRKHQDFHESCCEKIFSDIYNRLNPSNICVMAFYTRRGGIDINPCRYYGKKQERFDFRFWRQ
ncbi:MAG TPA: NADPH-dependent 7-cyano-7-deazaguanine reductase QueF [Spirochaetota bacterium]|nr:NADPH-dependent 7-cyano-7-deazaguanine reductase QueF [Spirochaetota bacterium]